MTESWEEKRNKGYVTCRGGSTCSNITQGEIFKPGVKACKKRKCTYLTEEVYYGVRRKICGVNGRIPGNLGRCPNEVLEVKEGRV